ncbi:hypothetical protein DFH07DRAFT_894182 [Mycena maculata]|uniref:BTB domain-containing protein n=1 Tax=Mycena maculata TaxID=230809 RepID=A0AAD7I2H0_9AGAR|nr:hypothetical protein DFH07DRAFT_894182 [Mycena maculata]
MEVEITYTHSSDVWFDDGSLIIEAAGVLYRISRSVLAERSPIFKDTLSIPQPTDSETIDGCPVVHLYDSPEDVTPFLRAIFNSGFFMPYPAPTEFRILAGILRLSHKYEVDYLRRRALVHLSSAYSTQLPDLDATIEGDAVAWIRPSWTEDRISVHVAAIGLARQVDAPWILPYAFYRAATIETSGAVQEILSSQLPAAQGWVTVLSRDDQTSFLKGYFAQSRCTITDILRFLYHPFMVEGCFSPQVCNLARLRALEGLREELAIPTNPLYTWVEEDWQTVNVCAVCLTSLRVAHRDARQAFWDNLPNIYDLPGWEELEQCKKAAIGDDLFS